MVIREGMTFAMPKEDGNLAGAYRWLPCTRCKDLSLGTGAHSRARGAPKGSVSYDQRTTTLKGIAK